MDKVIMHERQVAHIGKMSKVKGNQQGVHLNLVLLFVSYASRATLLICDKMGHVCFMHMSLL